MWWPMKRNNNNNGIKKDEKEDGAYYLPQRMRNKQNDTRFPFPLPNTHKNSNSTELRVAGWVTGTSDIHSQTHYNTWRITLRRKLGTEEEVATAAFLRPFFEGQFTRKQKEKFKAINRQRSNERTLNC